MTMPGPRLKPPGGVDAGGAEASSSPVTHPQHHLLPRVGNIHVAKSHVQAEFIHGAIAALCNIALTFPINKVVARQAYEGHGWRLAASGLRHDMARHGWAHGLYRGVAPPLMQRSISMGTMYGMFDFFYAQLAMVVGREGQGQEEAGQRQRRVPAAGVVGPGGGRSDLVQEVEVEDRLATDIPATTPAVWAMKAGAAALAGSVEALLVPFERVQTLLQHRHYNERYRNTWDAARAVAQHGPKEFYRGFIGVLARNCPANALFFTLRDPARDLIPATPPAFLLRQRGGGGGSTRSAGAAAGTAAAGAPSAPLGWWSFTRDFVSGAVLGACISTVVYPLSTVKNVMQLEVGTPHKGLLQVYRQVVADRGGVRGLFHGAHGNALRALLSWGVTNSAYELAKHNI